MTAQSYTCRCRFCGYTLAYMRADAGREIACTQCSQLIKLPGKLATISGVERARKKDLLGLSMEIGGFILMFLAYPWGLFIGLVLVIAGWRRCNAWLCGNCRTRLPSDTLESCPKCRIKFGAG